MQIRERGETVMLKVSRLVAAVVIAAAVVATVTMSTAGPARAGNDIPVLPGLKTQIEFWKQIFGTYSLQQVVIHDTWRLDHVYEVLDFQALADSNIGDAAVEGYIQSKVRE